MTKEKTQEELFDGLVEKVAERLGTADKLSELIRDVVHEQVSKSTDGLVKNRDDILEELKQQKAQNDGLAAMLKDGGQQQATKDIILSRHDARDPRKYHRAKADAEKAGVKVLVAGRNAPA